MGTILIEKDGDNPKKKANRERALRDIDRALEINSADGVGYFFRADMRAYMGRHQGAVEDYTRVIEIFGLKSDRAAAKLSPRQQLEATFGIIALHSRARQYEKLGQEANALAGFNKVLELGSGDGYGSLDKALLLARARDPKIRNPERAVEILRETLSNPRALDSNSTRLTLAMVLSLNGKSEEALKEYRHALERGPDYEIQSYQRRLKKLGHYAGPIDGKYGPAMERALDGCAKAACNLIQR